MRRSNLLDVNIYTRRGFDFGVSDELMRHGERGPSYLMRREVEVTTRPSVCGRGAIRLSAASQECSTQVSVTQARQANGGGGTLRD